MKTWIKYLAALAIFISLNGPAWAWHDETHLAIAKAAGYEKWYNAAGADITKIKAGKIEQKNHFSTNPPGTIITPAMVLEQASRYNDPDDTIGHLYGAIIQSIREYRTTTRTGKYSEYHLAFCSHYVGDLSQPLHNILHDSSSKKVHIATDGIIEDEVLNNLSRIEIYPIKIDSETDLAREIARIANLSTNLGYRLENEHRMLTKEDAYRQIGHSASLFKAILKFVGKK